MNYKQLVYKIRTFRKKPLVVVMGSTASGKTSAAVFVAKQLQDKGMSAEIVSADSRQIYAGIPIFSGAVTEAETAGVRHHLVGTEDVTVVRSADWFRHECLQLIEQIHNRGSVPIIAGGSAFWVQSILFKDDYPQVDTNDALRAELENVSLEELQERLRFLDAKRFSTIDKENSRRLIRSIEIATALGSVPLMNFSPGCDYKVSVVYFDLEKEILEKRIKQNVLNRYSQGLEEEASELCKRISKQRFRELGLAYKYMQSYWDGEITEQELIEKTTTEEIRYAKRQKTFCKKLLTRVVGDRYTISDLSQKEDVLSQLVSKINTF